MAAQMRRGAADGKLRRLAWREAALMVERFGLEVDMGVQLNIKDTETVQLAHDLAERMGSSLTEAVRAALKAAVIGEPSARARKLMDDLRALPSVVQVKGNARDAVRETHEAEWQERYGADPWS